MRSLRRTWAWLAAAVGLLGAATVDAGPIQWSYQVAIAGKTGKSRIAAGVHSLEYAPDPAIPDMTTFGDFYVTAPLPQVFSQDFGEVGSVNARPLAQLDPGVAAGFELNPPAELADDQFRLTLAITDTASGQSGSVDFLGIVGFDGGGQIGGFNLWFMGISGDREATLLLGDNRYDISVFDHDFEDITRIEADIAVSSTVQTPEPASVVLAAVGIVGGMIAARRRRRAG
jgi:hypothetical protein